MDASAQLTHVGMAELTAGLDHIRQSPKDLGALDMIVIRPARLERIVLQQCELSAAGGVHGDNWAERDARPDVQITIMNARMARLIAPDDAHRVMAGDQLFADLDLSYENLPVGQRLALGTAVLQITSELHKGCAKFRERFGGDALKFVSSEEGRRLNLRGIYAAVIQPGSAHVGDTFRKL